MAETASKPFSLNNSTQKPPFFPVLKYSLYDNLRSFKSKQKYQQYGPCFQTIFLLLITVNVALLLLSNPWEMLVGDFILVVYLLVPPACNFTNFTMNSLSDNIYKVFDHKSRCRTYICGCFCLVNLSSKQNILFASNGNWKNPFELRQSRDSHSQNVDPPWYQLI